MGFSAATFLEAAFFAEVFWAGAFFAGAVFFATAFLVLGAVFLGAGFSDSASGALFFCVFFFGAGFCSPPSLAFVAFCGRAEVARAAVSLSCGLGSFCTGAF